MGPWVRRCDLLDNASPSFLSCVHPIPYLFTRLISECCYDARRANFYLDELWTCESAVLTCFNYWVMLRVLVLFELALSRAPGSSWSARKTKKRLGYNKKMLRKELNKRWLPCLRVWISFPLLFSFSLFLFLLLSCSPPMPFKTLHSMRRQINTR